MKLCAALTLASLSTALVQNPAQNLGQNPARPTVGQDPTLTSHSTLVLMPALVRDKGNKLVFSLSANDFVLTDDGVPQKLHLEQDTGGEPLALVVDIEDGGDGARQLAKYESLTAMIDSIVGGVPHKVAVVGYDSSPVLVQDFSPDSDTAAKAIQSLIHDNNGDDGGATLDSLAFSVDLLRKQPIQYRRAILLIAESRDRGSHVRLDEALRAEYGGEKKALSPAAIRGLAVFMDPKRGNCAVCHTINAKYALFSDGKFHNTGAGVNAKGELADLGRYSQTKFEADKGAFKTPTLRNVALTAPYMHDGSLKTLKDVVDFYAGGGNSNPYLDKEMKASQLSGKDRADLVAFLQSLTGQMPKNIGPPEKGAK